MNQDTDTRFQVLHMDEEPGELESASQGAAGTEVG